MARRQCTLDAKSGPKTIRHDRRVRDWVIVARATGLTNCRVRDGAYEKSPLVRCVMFWNVIFVLSLSVMVVLVPLVV